MKVLETTKIGKIVADNYNASLIFTAHDIDFCCRGGISLKEACEKKNVPIETILSELELSLRTRDQEDYKHQPIDVLVQDIVNIHHKYIEYTGPTLLMYLDKLCRVHGDRHPELFEIKELFRQAIVQLKLHMKKEEYVLFPYILAMVESQKSGFPLSKPHFEDINNPIKMMEHEHSTEGDRFHKIAELTDHYICPPDGCQTYNVTYALLQEFETDLHKHVHLENNLLFPKAQKMFKSFNFN